MHRLNVTSSPARSQQAGLEGGPRARLRKVLLAVPWAAALFALLGLPHGALDHLVPGRLGWGWGKRFWPVLAYCLAYAGLAALYLPGWHAAPLAAFWLFLLVSLLH